MKISPLEKLDVRDGLTSSNSTGSVMNPVDHPHGGGEGKHL